MKIGAQVHEDSMTASRYIPYLGRVDLLLPATREEEEDEAEKEKEKEKNMRFIIDDRVGNTLVPR